MPGRKLLLITLIVAATPALAGPREDVYSGSLRCAAITDDRTWLECYYGAAQPMRGQLQLPPAPASQTSLIPPAIAGSASTAAAIGAPSAFPPRVPSRPGPVARTLDFLAGGDAVVAGAAIRSYDGARSGFTVTLENGQVWKQSDDQARFVRWRDGLAAHRVSVWKGALNTYNLAFDKEAERYKVRRIK